MRSRSATSRYTLIKTDGDQHLASFAEEVETGLGAKPKRIPCRFLYDAEGSAIFEEICDLPEYYLTRAELEILRGRALEIAAVFPGPITLAELGSGSSSKTRVLIEALLRTHGRLRYVPVDISRSMLEASALELLEDYDALEIRAIASEYREGLRHVHAERSRPKLIVWLGSSIGNLSRAESAGLLRVVRSAMQPADRMLVGIDLRKERWVLEAAYDDPGGVTARFSLNLLERMNRELGADFASGGFRHQADYLEQEGRVRIQLVSERDQRVAFESLGLELDFPEGEGIHIENSYKYAFAEIEQLAAESQMRVAGRWLDRAEQFSLNLLAPV